MIYVNDEFERLHVIHVVTGCDKVTVAKRLFSKRELLTMYVTADKDSQKEVMLEALGTYPY